MVSQHLQHQCAAVQYSTANGLDLLEQLNMPGSTFSAKPLNPEAAKKKKGRVQLAHTDDIAMGNDKCFLWYNQPSQLLNINPKPHIFTYQHTNNGKHRCKHNTELCEKEKRRLPCTSNTQNHLTFFERTALLDK